MTDQQPPAEPDAEEPIDVVQSVGELDGVVVALRDFLHDSGAIRAVAVLDGEPQRAMIDCARLEPIEVHTEDRVVALPHAIPLDAEAVVRCDVQQLPRFEVDPVKGEVASPMGGLEHHGRAVLQLAAGLGPKSVALATFATTSADVPLTITARVGEPLVIALGEETFEMAEGWPG